MESKIPLPVIDDRIAYSVEDAGRISGISRSLIYQEMKRGRLRFCKVGTRTLIRRAAIEAFLESLETSEPLKRTV